jgi:hypothetical protein
MGRDRGNHPYEGFLHQSSTSDQESFTMLLVIAIILLLLFGGLGFVAHVLWFGLILAVIILVAHMLTGSRA